MTPLGLGILAEYAMQGTVSQQDEEEKKRLKRILYTNNLIECEEGTRYKDNCFQITDKGRVFVRMLQNTPFPTGGFIDPRNNKPVYNKGPSSE